MINTRVLDILRTPDSIVADDITLLEKEIKLYPYVQSLRALYLLGTHKYYPDNFQKVLSETAAYTTDKKILYQLINKKPVALMPVPFVEEEEVITEENTVEIEETETVPQSNDISEKLDTEKVEESTETQEVIIDSEFEPHLDQSQFIEDSLESEIIEDFDSNEIQPTYAEEELPLEEEEIDVINSEDSVIVDDFEQESSAVPESPITIDEVEPSADEELSFHGLDDFLPNVKIEANLVETAQNTPVVYELTETLSPEDEMKRLIEAVEQKMKETKSEPKEDEEEEPIYLSDEINFAEGYLEPAPKENSTIETEEETVSQENTEIVEEIVPEVNPAWKPLNFETNTPDALLNKTKAEAVVEPKLEIPVIADNKVDVVVEPINLPTTEEVANTVIEVAEEERPVMNMSFMPTPAPTLSEVPAFTKDISAVKPTDSNVPNFINTWQSWLRIDRVEPSVEQKIDIEEIKNQAIETFIENEPRISQLKDQVNFVVKEKSDDISHLMTETLARLYIEQKLYSKAIKSFKILINKHPEKESYYKEVIKEIKEMRPRF